VLKSAWLNVQKWSINYSRAGSVCEHEEIFDHHPLLFDKTCVSA